jgi:hypothetical protein
MEAQRDPDLTLAALDATPLREASITRVRDWLARALAHALARCEDDACLDALGSPLSRPVLRDALATTLAVAHELGAALDALPPHAPRGNVALVLAANVETAVVRPLIWGLLARNAMAVRPSTRRPGLAATWIEALHEADPQLGRAIGLVEGPADDVVPALDAWADVLHVHGSDATVEGFVARCAKPVVGHGHGLGLAVLTQEALARAGDAEALFRALALDVARYDQRGCLSPQLVLIEPHDLWPAAEVAAALHSALATLDGTFPRGSLDEAERLAGRRWRDVALALGFPILEGSGHAVTLEAGALRSGPGARNVAVHALSPSAVDGVLASLGVHLKCIGAPDDQAVAELSTRAITRAPSAHVVRLGRMQTPSLLAPADGMPPWHGLVGPER